MKRLFIKLIALMVAFLVALYGIVAITTAQTDFKTPQELADDNGAFADVDGVSVYYVQAGSPDNPPVILIHGFGGSTFTWRDTLPALADAGFYAIAIDLPPFGLSDKATDIDYSQSGLADIVAGFMDTLDLETATIVGHSMGGGVTAQFAVRHPANVERVVFVAGGIFEMMFSEEAEEAEASDDDARGGGMFGALFSIDPDSPLATALFRALITPDFFADAIRDAYYDPAIMTQDVVEGYTRPLAIRNVASGFFAYSQAGEENPITLSELVEATGQTPVLILWGQADTWVPLQMGQRMNDALENATLITYEQTGHLPMEERPADFNDDLIAFLQGDS